MQFAFGSKSKQTPQSTTVKSIAFSFENTLIAATALKKIQYHLGSYFLRIGAHRDGFLPRHDLQQIRQLPA